MPKAAGKWNTYDITVKGNHITVILNGVQDSGSRRRPARQRPGRAAIRRRRGEVPQGPDPAFVEVVMPGWQRADGPATAASG